MVVSSKLPKAACPAGGNLGRLITRLDKPPPAKAASIWALGAFVVRNGPEFVETKGGSLWRLQSWLREAAFELLRRVVQVARCFLVVVVGLCLGGKVFLGKF